MVDEADSGHGIGTVGGLPPELAELTLGPQAVLQSLEKQMEAGF